jgi:hypothetical protein
MTRQTPLWLQQGTYAASVDRRLPGALWPAAAVLGCAVTVSSGMTVNVAAGSVAVPASNNTGSLLCVSDAVEPVTLAAAPGSGSNRYDLVICQARGNDLDGGTNNDFLFTTVTGTAAATPSVPATPNYATVLAQIYVPGGSASVTAGNITDVRRMMPGDPAKLPQGRLAYGQITAGTSSVSTETSTGISLPVTLLPNRYIRIEAYVRGMNGAVNGSAFLRVKEGATVINELQVIMNSSAGGLGGMMGRTITPTPGPHTYGLYYLGNGAGAYITADPTFPCWMEVIDLGGI